MASNGGKRQLACAWLKRSVDQRSAHNPGLCAVCILSFAAAHGFVTFRQARGRLALK